jgi:hypothetical protein
MGYGQVEIDFTLKLNRASKCRKNTSGILNHASCNNNEIQLMSYEYSPAGILTFITIHKRLACYKEQ